MQYHPDTGICVTRIPVSENFIGGIITMFLDQQPPLLQTAAAGLAF